MVRTRPGHVRPRRWRGRVVLSLLSVGLLCLTAWNLTRSFALHEAGTAYARGDFAEALGRSLQHLSRQPWSRDAAIMAATCLSRLDFADEAEPYYRRAGRLSLSESQTRAYGLVRGPHPERAIPVYNEILARSPENVTALRRLAAVLLAQEKTEMLQNVAERLLGIPGGVAIGETLRAVVYHNEANSQMAAAAFERALELDPELREIPLPHRLFWSLFTDDMISSGRIDDARVALSNFMAKSQDAGLMDRLGQIYLLQGSLDDAQRCFVQATEWGPNDYRPHFNLAKLALNRNDREVAMRHLKQARLLAPREYRVLYSLESVYRQLGNTAEADRIQDDLKRLRADSSSMPRSGPWPKYAL